MDLTEKMSNMVAKKRIKVIIKQPSKPLSKFDPDDKVPRQSNLTDLDPIQDLSEHDSEQSEREAGYTFADEAKKILSLRAHKKRKRHHSVRKGSEDEMLFGSNSGYFKYMQQERENYIKDILKRNTSPEIQTRITRALEKGELTINSPKELKKVMQDKRWTSPFKQEDNEKRQRTMPILSSKLDE
jgi:hypothetical protein